jgi:natural product biosynthesis luciferase-like monooxygenase protein
MKFLTGAGQGPQAGGAEKSTVSGHEAHRIIRSMIEQAQQAEREGFVGLTLAEHHFHEYAGVSGMAPAVVMAAMAEHTETLRFMPAIVVLPLHNPVQVAEEYAMLDIVSNGRLDFGTGRGYQPHEFRGYGIPLDQSRERLFEGIEIVAGLWNNETFSYDGKYFQLDEVRLYPKPVQTPIPIRVAAVSPDSFELVGKVKMDLLFAPSITPLEKLRTSIDIYKQSLKEHGGDPAKHTVTFPMSVYIGETEEECREQPRPGMVAFQKMNSSLMTKGMKETDPNYRFYKKAQANRAAFDYDKYYDRGTWLFCTAEEAVRRIKEEYQDYLGVDEMVCGFTGATPEARAKSRERFVNEVMPAFA